MVGLGVSSVQAQSPEGCFVHREGVDLGIPVPFVINGGIATYTPVEAFNNVGRTDGCDIEGAVVQFFCPGADGLPDLAAGTILSGPGGDDLPANPPAGTIISYPSQQCTINVGGGVTTATALVIMGDIFNTPPTDTSLGIWKGNTDEAFGIQKPVTVEVLECAVQVDKQVSCDGGLTWEDEGLVSANDDGTNAPCAGWNEFPNPDGSTMPAEPVVVRYQVSNAGSTGLFNCTVDESNPGIDSGPHLIPFLDVGATSAFIMDSDQTCSEQLEIGEPDTAMAHCFCSDNLDENFTAGATDSANFECQSPLLNVTKLCESVGDDGNNDVEIHVINNGTAVLENCVVTDSLYEDDPTCPPLGASTPTPVSPDFIGTLNPGDDVLVTGEVTIAASACNQVSVTCDIAGTDKQISADADDVCERGGNCLTRTPGFWGNHPHVVEEFLPVQSCGLLIDDTRPETEYSATEDMCKSGRDFKNNDTSPQQLSLIRHCTAAALNIAATIEGGGDCRSDVPTLDAMMEECCEDLCNDGEGGMTISGSTCIERLDAFNNLPDTLEPFGPFIQPGPAQPRYCRTSNGNGWVNPGRNLGPRN
jgi:hypothetical protein